MGPLRVLFLLWMYKTATAADVEHANATLIRIAFGSCHNARKIRHPLPDRSIWQVMAEEQSPQAFLWTGDTVYPPLRGPAPVSMLQALYRDMNANDTVGYRQFRESVDYIYGTWDDHDYGGNDMGKEMPQREERAASFWKDMLQQPHSPIPPERKGLYYTVSFGIPPKQVKVIFLDTRWHRDYHCIPSLASKIPQGAGISAGTRWIAAGLGMNHWWPFWDCTNKNMLGEEQWTWLQHELRKSSAQVHIVVSSIQVLTTDPTMEGWGHFPAERTRLLRLLARSPASGTVVLSGDVHHAEFLDPTAALEANNVDGKERRRQSFLEVTSSGLTHYCSQPFYGPLCRPLKEYYNAHRFTQPTEKDGAPYNSLGYYIGMNYGTIDIDWEAQTLAANIHEREKGQVVMTTGPRPFALDSLTDDEIAQVVPCVDGHMLPLVYSVIVALLTIIVLGNLFVRRRPSKS